MSDEVAYSTNERADRLMGRRPTDGIAFDSPVELGYHCPVCRAAPEWSEYWGFLWCPVCNLDVPSCLCVDLTREKDPDRAWRKAGIADAIDVFLSTVDQAVALATPSDGVS